MASVHALGDPRARCGCWFSGRSVILIGCHAGRAIGVPSQPGCPRPQDAAPIGWLWSLRAPARLHRRLRRAVTMTRSAVTPLAGRQLVVAPGRGAGPRAAFIDDRLVAAAPTRGRLGGLGREVAEVEVDARRLTYLAHSWRTQLQQAALASEPVPALDMRSRLDAFEAAMTELSQAGGTR